MPLNEWLFDNWNVLLRTTVIAVLSYLILIVFLRLSGKRTLAKMNAFDMVITVSLGSTLASIIVSKDVVLAQGALALGLLVVLQYAITWTGTRLDWVRCIVTGKPTLIVRDGAFLSQAMRRARVNEDDVRAAVRQSGISTIEEVGAVVLETDGSFSVLRASDHPLTSLVGIDLSEAGHEAERAAGNAAEHAAGQQDDHPCGGQRRTAGSGRAIGLWKV